MHLARFAMVLWCASGTVALAQEYVIVDDFERYDLGAAPPAWRIPNRNVGRMTPIPPDHSQPNDYAIVFRDGTNKVLRAYTKNESVQIALPQGDGLTWSLNVHPRLRWRWKALKLPSGAREDVSDSNDTGAALYVGFDCDDWLGRPCIIKYTYSSSLDVGTVATYGKLRALVLATAADGLGKWHIMERNVVTDYQRLFGEPPPGNPRFVMLWSDTDNTGSEADVYFDDLMLLPEG